MSRTNTTKAAAKTPARRSPAALQRLAETLDRQVADKFRDRPAHTPRMLKHARSAEREGAQLQRAAEFIRAYSAMLEQGDRPAALANFVPTKDRFLQIAARKGVMVSNGYHGYYVDGPDWIDGTPEAQAVRVLADNAKTPAQQPGERGGVSPPVNSARQLEIKHMIDQLRNANIEGFFPTPDPVIDLMLAAADMHDGQTVLEPSAGIGSICDRVKQAFPHTDLDAIELRPALQKILKAKGHAVVGGDFTEWTGNGRQYDRVLMNPPFEKGADMANVRQAFNHVKPGGRLVAIMSNGFRFRQTSRATGFRAWLEEMDGDVVELPDDAFNSSNAFRRTGVKAVMVAVQKPGWSPHVAASFQDADNPLAPPSHSPSNPAPSTHPAHPADPKPQAVQHAPQASPAASNAQQKTTPETPSFSTSKTSVPTHPAEKQDSEPPAESNAARTNPSGLQKSPEQDKERRNGNLLARHKPARLADIHGQAAVIRSLSAFAAAPHSNAFIFAGSSGVGKTAAAWALANELGCDPDWGGVVEIPSGTQDGRAVEDLLRRMHLRPMAGSGWKVVIINEADRMTPQAEVMWLDGLEKLPAKTVVVFTTNNLHKLTDRFIRRCEVQRFDATSDDFRDGMVDVVRQIWKQETGCDLETIPQDLGKFELGSDEYSIALALQQIAPYLRTGDPLPASFTVPIVRQERKPKLVASYGSTKVAEFPASRNRGRNRA
jgi:phospholipid N-methyltransferase